MMERAAGCVGLLNPKKLRHRLSPQTRSNPTLFNVRASHRLVEKIMEGKATPEHQ